MMSHLRGWMLAVCAVLACAGGVDPAAADTFDYTWSGAYGCGYWTTSTPTDPGYYGNGWGETWHYTESSDPYYPGASDAVLVPGGFTLPIQGTGHCGTLTVGEGAMLHDGKVEIHGGLLDNAGTLALDRSIYVHSPTFDVSGDGTIHLTGPVSTGGGSSSLYFFGHYCNATIAADQAVHGVGDIGVANSVVDRRQPNLTNHADIRADAHDSAPMRIHGWTTCTNDGLLVAGDGATMEIAGHWDNTGGTIRAEDGGVVRFTATYDTDADGHDDGTIKGGVLEALGDGYFTVTAGKGMVLEDLTLRGKLSVPAYGAIGASGTVTAEAGSSLLVSRQTSGSGTGTLYLHGHTTLAGAGETVFGDGGRIHTHDTATVDPVLTVGPDHTLVMRQTGHFDHTTPLGLINQGTMTYDPSIPSLNVGSTNYAYGGTTNYGTIVTGGNWDTRFTWYGDFVQQAGALIVNGYFQFNQTGDNYVFDILGGTLGGSGELRGGGDGLTIGPDATLNPGNSTGTLTLNTDVTVQDGADYVFEISDTDEDLVVVTGDLAFEGTIDVILKPHMLTGERTLDLTLFEFGSMPSAPIVNLSAPAGWTWGPVSQVGNALVLGGVTVPEPATVALLGAGALGLILKRRRA